MRTDLRLPGLFMVAFLVCAAALACAGMWRAKADAPVAGADALMSGEWTAAYEKAFGKSVLTYEPSIRTWGLLNYSLFKDGKDGVLIGGDGWLFTKEEFEAHPDAKEEIARKTEYVAGIRDMLAERNIRLIVMPLPAKARLYEEHLGRYRLPDAKKAVYADFVTGLRGKGVVVADPLPAMEEKARDIPLFLRTDTHWSPAGARLAARAVARAADEKLAGLAYEKTPYRTDEAGTEDYEGDLLRYVPLGESAARLGLPPDRIETLRTAAVEKKEDIAAASLFGDENLPVALVGTSYSANPRWHFEGFLKEALQTDILNAADEGLGPFETMKKYLEDEAFTTNPPRLVVWEVPERYLTVPYDLGKPSPGKPGGKLNI